MNCRQSLFAAALSLFALVSSGMQAVAQSPKKITNSIGMKLVLIPKGTFKMGSPADEPGRKNDEIEHQVTISRDYFMGTTEVTQSQYVAVMGHNPSKMKAANNADLKSYPVDEVEWEEAVEFCRRLSEIPNEKKAGRVYRLPTEAEWEYACRAGTKTAFNFGDGERVLKDYAWYGENSNDQPHPVGKKKPNGWGLYDMHGNVNEWCADADYSYSEEAVTDPFNEKNDLDPFDRVCRGGCWDYHAALCRSAQRDGSFPWVPGLSGIRVVMNQSEDVPKRNR